MNNENEKSFEELYIESLKDSKKIEKTVTGKVISITSKGEVFVDIGYKADGIIPKSEYSFDENIEPANELKIGDEITADVIKQNDGQGNVLLSYKRARLRQKRLIEENAKKEFWNNVEIGKIYKGTVTSLSSYGAFVELTSGVQGLLHISEMSWVRNKKPTDILKEGQQIEVRVIDLDKENRRIKLSYENKGPNPWENVAEKYHITDVVKVSVTKFMPFGVFVEIEPGVEGLVHISQICNKKIAKAEDELKIGEHVNAKIIDLDAPNHRMELSIRELEGTSDEYREFQEK